MRIFARTMLFLLASAWPGAVWAQFQQPTDEELKMTADPKAPGAAAVYLNYEEITDDPMHYRSVYARIKILEEKGKELATVDVPYVGGSGNGDTKVTDIKARTIHADGTVIPLAGKPEDLLTAKLVDRHSSEGVMKFRRTVFNLPSVEVGSILEYRYQIRYDDNHYSSPTWDLQHEYFVHKARYWFTPFKAFLSSGAGTSQYLVDSKGNKVNSLIWWTHLPNGARLVQEATGRFTLDVMDIPPIPDEAWMPPIDSVLFNVRFYYKPAFNSQDFWVGEAKRWSKDVDRFAEPSKGIREAVAGLIAPTDSDLDKAKKLYKAVQNLDNTNYSRQKSQGELKVLGLRAEKRAEDTWAQKGGSSEDITLLYLSMLRAAGLTAYGMKVVDRGRAVFEPSYMEFDQLTDDLVILSLNGKEMVLDPGEKMCPFQTVHWRHAGAGGVRESPDGRAAMVTPMQAYTSNVTSRVGDVNLDEHGTLEGTFTFVMTGQEALLWRQAALRNDEDEVKKQFDRWLLGMFPQGVEAHIDHFLALDDPYSNLIASVKATGSLGTATSKRILLPGFFFETRENHPFLNQTERLQPVDMHYGDQVVDEVTYHLPAGLAVEGAPQDARIPWEGHAVLVVKSKADTGKITIARQLSRAFTFAKPEEYKDLRGFYEKVAASDQQQLVLTASAKSGGTN